MGNPNIIAYLMLLVWPLVTVQLFKRLDPARALIWTILGGYLILPPIAAFNLPVVPDFDKSSIPNLMALAMAVFFLKDRVGILPDGWLGKGLIGLFVLSPFATVLTNSEPIPILQDEDIQGMRLYDSVAAVANQFIYLLPFFLARKYLATADAMKLLLGALVFAGLCYSVPMLIESRLSPQINIWVYGFFQHDFAQTIRFGGFRPMVFLPHGLWVAFFALMAFLSALIAFRIGPAEARPKQLLIVLYLAGVLLICRSAGPVVYALACSPLILLAPRRLQILVAFVLACIVVTYPALRGLHLIPVDQIVGYANNISAERAMSLRFRIENEELLLAHASEKPWFGWGGYARNLLHDPITGRVTTIADGQWIIRIGMNGWLGYLAEFGLLALPLLALGREAWYQKADAFSPYLCVVALILAFNMVDMLPNATLIPFTWLLAGAVLGHAETLARTRKELTRLNTVPAHRTKADRTVI